MEGRTRHWVPPTARNRKRQWDHDGDGPRKRVGKCGATTLFRSQASSRELMVIRAPTMNREFRPGPRQSTAMLPPNFTGSHDLTSPSIHNFLAGGNGDSQLWQAQFTTWAPRFTTWFTTFGRQMARMAISEQRLPFSRCVPRRQLLSYHHHCSRTCPQASNIAHHVAHHVCRCPVAGPGLAFSTKPVSQPPFVSSIC